MSRRKTTAEFILAAKSIHGDKYDYSLVDYIDNHTPVTIRCPEHGLFKQRPAVHLSGRGCPACGRNAVRMALSDNLDSFLDKARRVHGDKYDYSLVEYRGSGKKVTIICPDHGAFLQTPHGHISGQECPICGRAKSDNSRKKGLDVFLIQAHEVHGDKYDYSRVSLITRNQKVCIICPEHGPFWQTPTNHVVQRQGCPTCARKFVGIKNTKDQEWFLAKAREVHGNKYDYSEAIYTKARDKVCIICHEKDDGGVEHGRFWITPQSHLTHASGCPKCGHPRHTTTWWIQEARKIHGDRYDYSKVEYTNNHTQVTIVCPEHGEFKQFPMSHLRGVACPKCSGRNLSTEEFIDLARSVHGDKYGYEKVRYTNKTTEVCITCPEHGDFWQLPNRHLKGVGCPTCGSLHNLMTTEEFIIRAKETHGDKYDYSKVEYRGTQIPVCIICPEHGEFYQAPHNHINGSQCPKCVGREKITTQYFIERAKIIHNNKYDYSKVDVEHSKRKVCIICPEHGEFWQTPNAHLLGCGCRKCANVYMDQEYFIEKAKLVHGDKYDYSKVEYVDSTTKVCIICPEHGEFWQNPSSHLQGYNCPKCSGRYMDTAFFKEKCTQIHGGKYDYSLVDYHGAFEKVSIICPTHGVFLQKASQHLNGSGCPMCAQSHLETSVMRFLKKQKIKFEAQKAFDWLYYQGKMYLDFFLPNQGIAIECQGGQHFHPIDFFGGNEAFLATQKRDTLKRHLCRDHGIKVLYYSDLAIHYPYPVFEDLNALLQAIKDSDKADPTLWKDPELPFVFED